MTSLTEKRMEATAWRWVFLELGILKIPKLTVILCENVGGGGSVDWFPQFYLQRNSMNRCNEVHPSGTQGLQDVSTVVFCIFGILHHVLH